MDYEFVKKMVRAVVQSKKEGVSINKLHSEYWALCGDSIPLAKLGFSNLEDLLRSMPSVVCLEYCMGELKCFAVPCEDTYHIAKLIAKQKSTNKSGHSQVVNCKMRFKPFNMYMMNVRPSPSLRQPRPGNMLKSRFPLSSSGCSATGDYRQLDQMLKAVIPLHHRQPASQQSGKQMTVPDGKEKLQNTKKLEVIPEVPQRQVSRLVTSPSDQYDVVLVQGRVTQLLQKHSSGVWMSKLSDIYSQMFNQKLLPQAIADMEKWKHICMVENHSNANRKDKLLYPPLPLTKLILHPSPTSSPLVSPVKLGTFTPPSSPSTPDQNLSSYFDATPPKNGVRSKSVLAKPTFIFPPQPAGDTVSNKVSPSVRSQNPADSPALAPQLSPGVHQKYEENNNLPDSAIKDKKNCWPSSPTWTSNGSVQTPPPPGRDTAPLSKVASCPPSSSVPPPSSPASAVVPGDVRQRIEDLLSRYSMGLWAHALPKLFMETYKTQFPDHILNNLSLLLDFCCVEYTSPPDKTKAILYKLDQPDLQQNTSCLLPSGLELIAAVVPPRLLLPSEQYPSVLVTEAKSSNAVTVRYVGENYSKAQEAMEDMMASFYSQSSKSNALSNPSVGQLVAVRGLEEREELARAQVMEIVSPSKVKVYYVDHGYSIETSMSSLLKLHQDFASLPFQATNVRLAGLEAFSSDPLLLSYLEKTAVEKILLIETVAPSEQNKTPVVVLYDTSQDDDININSSCLKALQDSGMNNPLQVGGTYQDVSVTNVCADGIIYCQLPSRGMAKLSKLLEATEVFFTSRMTSDCLVSKCFDGKFCLARYKGKWARIEITSVYGRVVKIFFVDMGVPATVEVTDLREIPPPFLKGLIVIPPQAVKCFLAELTVPEGDWTPETVLLVKDAVQVSKDCKMKVLKIDQHKGDNLVYMYLFVGVNSQELHDSVNHQLVKLTAQNDNKAVDGTDTAPFDQGDEATLSSSNLNPADKMASQKLPDVSTNKAEMASLPMPPPPELSQPGHNMDVFVPVACHPGYFVMQRLEDLHKLTVLTGEMMLHYDQSERSNVAISLGKGEVYAAKINRSWRRVQVKGILTNGLVSVYELDHGKHELVRKTVIQPLIEDFRKLPFLAIAAQLAGVEHEQWSEESSMLFRNHVENRALVAQVESVQEMPEVHGVLWERRVTVYLVDTSVENADFWIHSIMADMKH